LCRYLQKGCYKLSVAAREIIPNKLKKKGEKTITFIRFSGVEKVDLRTLKKPLLKRHFLDQFV